MERRLTAILVADVVGYSRLMSGDEAGTLATLKHQRTTLFDPTIAAHKGRVVKLMGDGVLVEFGSVIEAVQCAIEIQEAIAKEADNAGPGQLLLHRIGVNLGDVVVEGEDLYGDGVNVAARLQALAQAGGVAISDDAYRQVRDRLDIVWHDLGQQEIKNIPRPVRVWEWRSSKPVPERLKAVAPALPDRPSIVILPFRKLGLEPEQDYLAEGLRIDIQNALVKVSGLFIIAHASASALRENTAEVACRHVGVRYALEGCVHRVGRRVRIAMDLVEGHSGRIVWAESFDRRVDDCFEVIDEITSRVLTAMNVTLVAGEPARVWHKALHDLKSLEALYKGIFEFSKMTRDALSEARRYFEFVGRTHPESAIGPTWVAFAHWYDFQRGWSDSPERSKELAQEWAERAATMEDTDGQAHTVLSHVHLLNREFDAALEAGRDAVSNRPNCTYANGFYANVLHYCGEQQAAIHHADLAIRHSPIYPPLFKDILALSHWAAGDEAAAITAATEAISVNPSDVTARLVLAILYSGIDQREQAAELVEEIKEIEPAFSLDRYAQNQPYRDPELLDRFVSALRQVGLTT